MDELKEPKKIGLIMISLERESERVGVAPTIGNMVESPLWFEHLKTRNVDSVVMSVDQMEGNLTTRGRGRARKAIRKTKKKYLETNGFIIDMLYDRLLWHRGTHLADPT